MPWPWKRRTTARKTSEKKKREREHIERVAYELYQNRRLLNRPGDAQSDWETATKIVKSSWHTTLFASHRPLIQLEKKVWEPLLAWANNQALLSLLGLIGNVGLIIAVITYVGSEKQRRDAEVLNAWQTLTSAHGQSGNGGRIQALEFLNASPGANWRRRAICLWICTWPAESLAGINLSVDSADTITTEQENSSIDEFQMNEISRRVYLGRIQLLKANLTSANLRDVDLEFANLRDATLWYANLQGADLWYANLQGANLVNTNLQDVRLASANLQGAISVGTNLQGADLFSANLQNANLTYANLQDADLGGANLEDVDLSSANLQNADLQNTNLQNADLQNTNLQNAILRGANLQNAGLRGANFEGAIFLATDLREIKDFDYRVLQIKGDNPPLICNSPLPRGIEIQGGKDRDCDQIVRVLLARGLDKWNSPEVIETFVLKGYQDKIWD